MPKGQRRRVQEGHPLGHRAVPATAWAHPAQELGPRKVGMGGGHDQRGLQVITGCQVLCQALTGDSYGTLSPSRGLPLNP